MRALTVRRLTVLQPLEPRSECFRADHFEHGEL